MEWEPFDWDRRREERFLFAIKYGTQEQIDAALEELMSRLDGLQPGDWSYAAGLAGIAGFVFRTAQRYETETPGRHSLEPPSGPQLSIGEGQGDAIEFELAN